jgi:hypothetical protein
MSKHRVVAMIVCSVLATSGSIAVANPGYFPGNMCHEASPTTDHLYRGAASGQYILSAITTTSEGVMCPVQTDSSTIDPSDAVVTYSETSSIDDVACTPYLTDDGVTTGLGTRFSCATVGGCTSANLSWQGGAGTLSWGNVIGSISGRLAMTFACNLGQNDSAEIDWILSYELTY